MATQTESPNRVCLLPKDVIANAFGHECATGHVHGVDFTIFITPGGLVAQGEFAAYRLSFTDFMRQVGEVMEEELNDLGAAVVEQYEVPPPEAPVHFNSAEAHAWQCGWSAGRTTLVRKLEGERQ